MKFDYNVAQGTVTGLFTVEEFQLVAEAMRRIGRAVENAKADLLPDVAVFHVRGYTQVYVCARGQRPYWACSCNDYRYRRQSPPGEPASASGHCKHIPQARVEHIRANQQLYTWPGGTHKLN